jgi:predicted ATPase/DNA-binding CsgD family transcriptional regulator
MRRGHRGQDSLPPDVTTLIGRTAESAEVKALLQQYRLVTLWGTGGVGKTRLAFQVARTVRGAFGDGVWTVRLADLSEPDLIAATVGARLGVGGSAGVGVADLVAEIGDQQLLLVLDNCEHLADAAAELVDGVLQGCPYVRILATSREALRVEGEALFLVPPLALPAPGAEEGGRAQQYDGVALFLERAGAHNADIAAGRYDEQAVVELCRHLDGLPLAIELAASGSRWLSVESMLALGADPLADAVRAARFAPERHRSIRASLDYSHRMCSAEAQVLWARMSVFRGGATRVALDTVCAGVDLPQERVWPALCELIDKSLVQLDGSRYRMLETIRLYGAARLEERGETETVRRAHLDWVVAMAEAAQAGWFSPDQPVWLTTVLADQANVRAALEGTLTTSGTAGTGLRIASLLWMFWISSGLPGEGRLWLGRLLEASDEADPERAPALWIHGFLSAVNGDIPEARRSLQQCERLAELTGDVASAAHARSSLGIAELFDGNVGPAIELLESGVEMERTAPGAHPYMADALINLGLAYCYRGRLDDAHAVLTEALQLCTAHHEEMFLSWALAFLGLEALLRGRPEAAAGFARESLVRKRDLNNVQGIGWAIELSAWAAVEAGDASRAAVLLGAGEARTEDFGPAFHGFVGMHEWHAHYAGRTAALLSPAAYRAATERGRRLSLDEATAIALGETLIKVEEGVPEPLRDLPLTPREREIAHLVATGRTNREIAHELVIAPRTVDTHVQHILTKLNFTSRSQVAALIGTAGAAAP